MGLRLVDDAGRLLDVPEEAEARARAEEARARHAAEARVRELEGADQPPSRHERSLVGRRIRARGARRARSIGPATVASGPCRPGAASFARKRGVPYPGTAIAPPPPEMPNAPGAILRQAMNDAPRALAEMTLDQWAAMDEDEEGELVDGILVEEEMPSCVHELAVTWLVRMLGNWLGSRGGFVFGSEAKFAVAPQRGRKPDLTVYLPGGRRPEARGIVRVPPDIAVEIVSPTPRDGRRDRVEKVADYAQFGVRWYWLVDPSFRSFEILERDADGRYVHALAATDEPLAPPGCDGLVIDVPALWAEIARLEE